jgi:hypothetical protein
VTWQVDATPGRNPAHDIAGGGRRDAGDAALAERQLLPAGRRHRRRPVPHGRRGECLRWPIAMEFYTASNRRWRLMVDNDGMFFLSPPPGGPALVALPIALLDIQLADGTLLYYGDVSGQYPVRMGAGRLRLSGDDPIGRADAAIARRAHRCRRHRDREPFGQHDRADGGGAAARSRVRGSAGRAAHDGWPHAGSVPRISRLPRAAADRRRSR